jgi:hypothetical protein
MITKDTVQQTNGRKSTNRRVASGHVKDREFKQPAYTHAWFKK